MNVLFLTTKFPYPPDDGGKIDTLSNLKILAKNYKVFLFYVGDKNKKEEELKQKIRIEKIYNFSKKTGNSIFGIIKNIFSAIPYTLNKYRDREIYKKTKNIIQDEDIKIVLADHLHMAFYGKLIKKDFPQIKIILREHNVESIFLERAFREEKNSLKKIIFWWQKKKLAYYEKKIVKYFDKCFMISRTDEENLKKLCPEVKTVVVPTALDPGEYQLSAAKIISRSLAYIGDFSWPPNTQGVLWFLNNVWPKVVEKFPDAKFFIIGKNPPKKLLRKQKDGVVVTGYVKNAMSWIKKSEVFVVPIFFGGGIRIKILEAMAMQKPVISTSIGAEGIKIKDEKDLLIADNEVEFINKINLLFNDKHLRENLSKNAKNLIETQYSVDTVEKELKQAIDQLLVS